MATNNNLSSEIFCRGNHEFKWVDGILYRLDLVLKSGNRKRSKCWCIAAGFQKWITPDPCNAEDVAQNPKILADAIKLHQLRTGAYYH